MTSCHEIAITLLRCVGWLSRDDLSTRNGHAGPYLETPKAQMLGEWDFYYSIILGQKNFRQAWSFDSPLRAVSTDVLRRNTMVNIVKRSPRLGDIARFDPFTSMEDWFKGFGLRPLFNEMDTAPLIKIDLTENDKTYTIHAEVPGVNKEDIKVQVDGNRVSISAETKKEKEGERIICRECYQGSSYRSFTLDSDVDETKAEAKYENGVLELPLIINDGEHYYGQTDTHFR